MALIKALLAGLFVWLLCVLAFAPLTHAGTRAAFVYPWFPETTFGNYQPSIGFYSSDVLGVQRAHVRQMERMGFQAAISSWWTKGDVRDRRLEQYLRTTRRYGSKGRRQLKWSLYYECEGNAAGCTSVGGPNPSSTQLASDLTYLYQQYGGRREWLRVSGKPVLFVYGADDTTCEVVNRWNLANAGRFYVVHKVFTGYTTCAADSWHQYSGASALQCHLPYSCVISPGFWLYTEPTPRLVRDIARWRQNVRDCTAALVQWCLVVSFNEWGEGTAVESATAWPSSTELGQYGDALHNNGEEPVVPTDPVITAAGDISCPSTSCNDDETALLLEGTALTLGDNQYDTGTQTEYLSYQSWPRTAKSSPGNHDPCPSSYYDEWFTPPACWYSYDLGNWHLISLDSNVPSNSTQLGWLTNDLNSTTRSCVLAYWHHPRYSSGNYAPGISSVQPLLDRLAGKVDVVLNGHDHNYERFGPRSGYRQFIVGTGGRSHYGQGTPQPLSEVRNSTAYGVLKMVLQPTSYTWQFKPTAGTFTDAGSGVCS